MRLLRALALMTSLSLMLVPAVSRAALAPDTTAIDRLRPLLVEVPNDPMLLAAAQAVRQRLGVYDETIKHAKVVSRKNPLRIDVIGQFHTSSDGSFSSDIMVDYSQYRIRQLLDSLKYERIGVEALFDEKITMSSLLQFELLGMRRYGREMNRAIDTLECAARALHFMKGADGLYYLADHPQAKFSGIEEERLYELHGQIITYIQRQGHLADVTADDLEAVVSHCRSEMAVANMILLMDKYHNRRAVIIFGLFHQGEMEEVLHRYGIHGSTFTAMPPDHLPADWWK